MSSLKNIAIDMVNFTVSNVNDAISFKPHLCKEVPPEQYNSLKNWYIEFTGTSIRKNKCRLFFLPINVSDELQQLNPVIPDEVKITNPDNCELTYYKNRLITELDFENVRRVQKACVYIAYAAINQLLNLETDPTMILESNQSNAGQAATIPAGYASSSHSNNNGNNNESIDATESCYLSLKKGEVLGFRELGHLINITPWHFHRVFKVITGLTIREYGQLCVEFLKKNSALVNPVATRVEQLKEAGDAYSCLDDDKFMIDDTFRYECDDKCIILPDYFIDLTKSKESKRKGNDSPPSTASSNCNGNGNVHQLENEHSKNQHPTSGLSRSEQRKRRSSVMIQKIRNASVCSFSTNPSIQSAMNNGNGNGNDSGSGNGASSPVVNENCESLTSSPSSQGQGMQLGTYISGEGATYLRHPSTSTIGLRRKSKVSRNGSITGMENHGMVSKAKHKRNVSDPVANINNSAGNGLLADKIDGDLSLFGHDGQFQQQVLQQQVQPQGQQPQGLADAFNFPSPQVDFKFNMFDEPDLGLNMDVNLNSLNLSEMALNSISMNMGALHSSKALDAAATASATGEGLGQDQGQDQINGNDQVHGNGQVHDLSHGLSHGTVTVSTSEVDSRLPSDDITEMSSFSMNPSDQFQYVHTDKHRHSQALHSNTSVLHLDKVSEPQSLSSTLPTTPQDVSTLLPMQGHESLLLEFSPEEPGSALSGLDPLYPLYPSSMLTAVPSDAFASYEDFIAN